MRSDIKVIRVYAEDWKKLNDLLLVEQAKQKKRLSFADLIHELLGKVEVSEVVLSDVQRS